MIERLRTTLLALAVRPASAVADPGGQRLVADGADALRLQLDCPQQELTPGERKALHALGELLETDGVPAEAVSRTAGQVVAALGLAPVDGSVRAPHRGVAADGRVAHPGATPMG